MVRKWRICNLESGKGTLSHYMHRRKLWCKNCARPCNESPCIKINIFLLLSSFNSFNSWRKPQYLHIKRTMNHTICLMSCIHHSPSLSQPLIEMNSEMHVRLRSSEVRNQKLQLYQNIYQIFVDRNAIRSVFVGWSHFPSVASCLVIYSQHSNILHSLWHFYFYTKWRCRYFWEFFFFSHFAFSANCHNWR